MARDSNSAKTARKASKTINAQPSKSAHKNQKEVGRGRFHTDAKTKILVWIRAAGHCELCGVDLTQDLRTGTRMKWGEVAHIMPASADGPRASSGHDAKQAEELTNDPDNLVLACPSCHDKADTNAEGYPANDLRDLHQAQIDRIRLAATVPDDGKSIALIFLSQHFQTMNLIGKGDLQRAMSAEGLHAITDPIQFVLPPPLTNGRDSAYWDGVEGNIKFLLEQKLNRACTFHGDPPVLSVVGLADIPALIVLGQALGDRFRRRMFSFHRISGLRWPELGAPPPTFSYQAPPPGNGPVALVLSISAEIPERDVLAALPNGRIATISINEPGTLMVKNRKVIEAFIEALQTPLSDLEAMTPDPIHVFAAIPAALAIEFGAFLTMQHRHPYLIYDRDDKGKFFPALELGYHLEKADEH